MTLIRFNTGDVVVKDEKVGVSTWTNNTNNLQTAHTSSTQDNHLTPTGSSAFYLNVFQDVATATTAEVQYAVSYGHKFGSGSLDFTNDVGSIGLSAARTIYGQFRNLVFGDETQDFTFGTHTSKDIYVINVNRSRYKQQLKLGTLNLHLSGTLPFKEIHLTDDSVTNGQFDDSNLGPVYRVVSGSNGQVSGSTVNQVGGSSSFGLFYPESGVIVLNGDAFSGSLAPTLNSGETSNSDRNHQTLFNHISGAGHFILDTTEEISSKFYFVRARNSEYNYSNNESFKDANNNVRFTSMQSNPKVFITTVGLYNSAQELLAIAKLSQPILKSTSREALIKVKLDF